MDVRDRVPPADLRDRLGIENISISTAEEWVEICADNHMLLAAVGQEYFH